MTTIQTQNTLLTCIGPKLKFFDNWDRYVIDQTTEEPIMKRLEQFDQVDGCAFMPEEEERRAQLLDLLRDPPRGWKSISLTAKNVLRLASNLARLNIRPAEKADFSSDPAFRLMAGNTPVLELKILDEWVQWQASVGMSGQLSKRLVFSQATGEITYVRYEGSAFPTVSQLGVNLDPEPTFWNKLMFPFDLAYMKEDAPRARQVMEYGIEERLENDLRFLERREDRGDYPWRSFTWNSKQFQKTHSSIIHYKRQTVTERGVPQEVLLKRYCEVGNETIYLGALKVTQTTRIFNSGVASNTISIEPLPNKRDRFHAAA